MNDISELDRVAVDYTVTIVSMATADDLSRPTPCAEWDLAQLLAHMTAQHRGFAAAARGHGGELSTWQVRQSSDPVADYAAAAAEVSAAFSETGVLQRDFELPEFGPGFVAPGELAVGFHFVDYVVHGWDVARALAVPYAVDERVAGRALEIAQAVPDGEERLVPGAPFAPATADREAPDVLARTLALLGRSPQWTAPAT